MYLKVGSFLYISLSLTVVLITILFGNAASKKGKEWSLKIIQTLIWINFILHFAKQLNPAYIVRWPEYLKRSTLENLCAALIALMPLLYFSKKKWALDYILVFGFLSGMCALIYPSSPMEFSLTSFIGIFELIRYYFCHTVLIIISVVMVCGNVYQFSYKRVAIIWIVFILHQYVVFTSEFLSMKIGLSGIPYNEFFLRDGKANGTLAFGPYSSLDPYISWLYFLIPNIFKHALSTGEIVFTPVLWMIVPTFCLIPLLFSCTLIITYDEFSKDFYVFRSKAKQKILYFISSIKR